MSATIREIATRNLNLIVSSLAPHKLAAPVIDNFHGWGSTPNAAEISYLGAVIYMRPSVYKALAEPHNSKKTDAMQAHLLAGGGIAAPYLKINVPDAWYDGDYSKGTPVVVGHEGRHRMASVQTVFGDILIETHLLIESENHRFRNRHILPALLQALNLKAKQQSTKHLVRGPLFSLHP